ncbi:MAG: hypothetical protein IIA87_03960 [Nanoarchaeota archaeon]|nr:hypothetical protein [Nanoarchaeota archaeon]
MREVRISFLEKKEEIDNLPVRAVVLFTWSPTSPFMYMGKSEGGYVFIRKPPSDNGEISEFVFDMDGFDLIRGVIDPKPGRKKRRVYNPIDGEEYNMRRKMLEEGRIWQ